MGRAGRAVLPTPVSEGPSDDMEEGGTGRGRGDCTMGTPALTLSKHSPRPRPLTEENAPQVPPGAALRALRPSQRAAPGRRAGLHTCDQHGRHWAVTLLEAKGCRMPLRLFRKLPPSPWPVRARTWLRRCPQRSEPTVHTHAATPRPLAG